VSICPGDGAKKKKKKSFFFFGIEVCLNVHCRLHGRVRSEEGKAGLCPGLCPFPSCSVTHLSSYFLFWVSFCLGKTSAEAGQLLRWKTFEGVEVGTGASDHQALRLGPSLCIRISDNNNPASALLLPFALRTCHVHWGSRKESHPCKHFSFLCFLWGLMQLGPLRSWPGGVCPLPVRESHPCWLFFFPALCDLMQLGPLRSWPAGVCLPFHWGRGHCGPLITPLPHVKQVRVRAEPLPASRETSQGENRTPFCLT